MKLLHTSDWHLGKTLYLKKRYDEFQAFLDWLLVSIKDNQIDVLLVAGDIFDTTTPSNRAQELYYRFLCRVSASSCRHVVVVAGNHDSPSFLNAPKDLLKALNVHVIGSKTEVLEDEVLVLCDEQGAPELIVCAVPYLRDRDIRVAEVGESIQDKEQKLMDGIRNHYESVAALAESKRQKIGAEIPIVATGHIFTAGGQTIEGDGVRELYVGSLAHVSASIFPPSFNYVALGHLHIPQKVSNSDIIRYSGSPIPMGFGEAKQQKSVCQVEFDKTVASVKLIDVPRFQKLERVRGDWPTIFSRMAELSATGQQAWVEVTYDGDEVISDLGERIHVAIAGSQLEILRVKNNRVFDRVMAQIHGDETLDDLNADEVFERCLEANKVPSDQRPELLRAYKETLSSLHDNNTQA